MLNCPICTHLSSKKYKGHCGYQQTYSYDIYHCSFCDAAFSNPMQVENELYNLIYRKIGELPGYSRYLHYANEVLNQQDPLDYLSQAEDIYWAIQQQLNSVPKHFRLLEIGSGFGYLTYALSKKGFTVTGLDISSIAVQQAKQRYGDLYICADVKEYCQTGVKYDVIIFTEVIEHIADIQGFMRAVDQLLIPGGRILLTTPNKSVYPKDVLWETEPPPVHLWWFSENSIATIAKQLNYHCSFVDFTVYNKSHPENIQAFVRQFQPTRLPRLDSLGNVISHGDYIPYTPEALVDKESRYITQLRCLFERLGLLSWIRHFKKWKQSHRRATLCAILTKQKSD